MDPETLAQITEAGAFGVACNVGLDLRGREPVVRLLELNGRNSNPDYYVRSGTPFECFDDPIDRFGRV